MSSDRTLYKDVYAPRAVPKAILKAFVEALADFKPGLPTTSRKISARAISAGKSTELEGPESWKVTDPHSAAELEQVRVVLSLVSTESRRCELEVEFRSGQIVLSVSDIETGWGKSVFEDTRVLLGNLGIFSGGLNEWLRWAYALLDNFQNVLLVLSAAGFAAWLTDRGITYLYSSLALFVAGVMPALTRSYYFLSPPGKTPIFQDAVARSRNIPWAEATAVLAFLTGVIQFAIALVAIAW